MSFIIDIPLLVIWGIILAYLNKKFLRKGKKDALLFLEVLTILVFWGVSIPIYLHPNIQPSPGLHPIALLLFLSYPLWLLWGVNRGRVLFGRSQSQEGVLWLFRS